MRVNVHESLLLENPALYHAQALPRADAGTGKGAKASSWRQTRRPAGTAAPASSLTRGVVSEVVLIVAPADESRTTTAMVRTFGWEKPSVP